MKNAEIAYQLGVLFDKKITSHYRESYKGVLGMTQIQVLDYLYQYKEARVQELAHALNIPKQHASKVIVKFQEENLFDCRQDSNDRRSKIFFLTEKGQQFIEKHINESNHYFDTMISSLDEAERYEMLSAMKTMVDILNKV